MSNSYLPITLNLSNKKILFIGAGNVAYRKFIKVKKYSSNISILSLEFNREFENHTFNKIMDYYNINYLEHYDIVFICTNDKTLNLKIASDCASKNILYNNSTSKDNMDFKMMASFEHENFTINISSKKELKDIIKFKEELMKLLKK
ncbi:precorrin-2 dehydrogenase/sirohydrochlorin ferrochelatase [Bacilli bacterium PM5-3]|nr:precorrin-2 dehydrogenase/sirohydrochlorin ferrochelatase [Bacilli bacterium PM5-3]